MLKKIIYWIIIPIVTVLVVFGLFYKFKHDETFRFLINTPLSDLASIPDQADPDVVYAQILNHQNPPPAHDDFDGVTFSDQWTQINLNGKGVITHPPEVHAANVEIIDGEAVISVYHDLDFEDEYEEVRQEGNPARMQYNNGYMTGMDGYSPTLTEDITAITRFRVDPHSGGTTGSWIEEDGTFRGSDGVMVKPFRAFGVSYFGPENHTFLRGVTLEAVVGMVPVCAKQITGVNPFDYNTYKMVWSLVSKKTMRVDLFVNDVYKDSCDFPSFYLGEIQLWADNYSIEDLMVNFFNVPLGRVDSTHYDFVDIYATSK